MLMMKRKQHSFENWYRFNSRKYQVFSSSKRQQNFYRILQCGCGKNLAGIFYFRVFEIALNGLFNDQCSV